MSIIKNHKIKAFLISLISVILTTSLVNTTEHSYGEIQGRINFLPKEIYRHNLISVSLEGADRTAFVNENGLFTFYNVPVGVYILNVNDLMYEYEQIFIEVSNTEAKAFNYNSKLGKKGNRIVEYPFEVNSITKIKYEEDSPNVVGSIIKSPYAIIIGISLIMYFCMQMVPQEQLKEMEQMNKQMGQFQNLFKK